MTMWKEASLTDLGTIERGRSRHRPRNDPRLFGEGLPFFQTGDVKAATLHMTRATQEYSEFGVAQSRVWEPGITCITIAANIAESAVLGVRGCFPDSVLGFAPAEQDDDAYFVKYLLDVHKERLTDSARGTTQDNLSMEKLLSHSFPIPDAIERSRIAGVLRSIDELIENNRRRVQVLEEMARAIYREWFVHFRYPGHGHVPLVDSPLGPIPDGWEVQPFSELASFVNGFAFKPAHWGDSGRPIIKIKQLKQGVTPDTPRCDPDSIAAKYWIEPGDLLFSWSADLGVYRWSDEPGLLNQHLFVVTPDDRSSVAFLHHALDGAMPQFWDRAQGTTMRHIKRSALSEVTTGLPPHGLIRRFTEVVDPIDHEASVLGQETRNLAALRDLLLPKLVTGQIDVSRLDLDELFEVASA